MAPSDSGPIIINKTAIAFNYTFGILHTISQLAPQSFKLMMGYGFWASQAEIGWADQFRSEPWPTKTGQILARNEKDSSASAQNLEQPKPWPRKSEPASG